MHESGLVSDLLRRVLATAEAAGARQILSVSVQLGALSGISPAHLAEHFHQAAGGTAAAGAELRIRCDGDVTAPDAQGILLVDVEVDL